MNRRWICSDVLVDIFPFFDRPQLGLKLALISPRFDALVDTYFDGKSELAIWRGIEIKKDTGAKVPKLSVFIDYANSVSFPWPDRPLPNKIGFKDLRIEYIDHSVLTFLRSNHQIWDKRGISLSVHIYSLFGNDVQPIWKVFVREIWPIFAPNIRYLNFTYGCDLENLRRHTSPTILTDLNQLKSINTYDLFPDRIVHFDGPIATAGQALSKWVHTPREDGKSKHLACLQDITTENCEWINGFKEAFLRRATTTSAVRYNVLFIISSNATTQIEPFELVNERTKEKLTLEQRSRLFGSWRLKRRPIGEKAPATVRHRKFTLWDGLNGVNFYLSGANCIGPLSPPAAKKADQKRDNSSIWRRLFWHKKWA